jgi:hypothetical protein
MDEGALLLRALHEHRDHRPHALADGHHENLVLVAKENRVAIARRGYGADLRFDNGFTHIANLVTRLPRSLHRLNPVLPLSPDPSGMVRAYRRGILSPYSALSMQAGDPKVQRPIPTLRSPPSSAGDV